MEFDKEDLDKDTLILIRGCEPSELENAVNIVISDTGRPPIMIKVVYMNQNGIINGIHLRDGKFHSVYVINARDFSEIPAKIKPAFVNNAGQLIT